MLLRAFENIHVGAYFLHLKFDNGGTFELGRYHAFSTVLMTTFFGFILYAAITLLFESRNIEILWLNGLVLALIFVSSWSFFVRTRRFEEMVRRGKSQQSELMRGTAVTFASVILLMAGAILWRLYT